MGGPGPVLGAPSPPPAQAKKTEHAFRAGGSQGGSPQGQ